MTNQGFFFPGNTIPLKNLAGFHSVFIGQTPWLETRTIALAEPRSLDEDRIWLENFGLSAVGWYSAHLLSLESSTALWVCASGQ